MLVAEPTTSRLLPLPVLLVRSIVWTKSKKFHLPLSKQIEVRVATPCNVYGGLSRSSGSLPFVTTAELYRRSKRPG